MSFDEFAQSQFIQRSQDRPPPAKRGRGRPAAEIVDPAFIHRGGASAMDEGWINYFRRWAATPSFRRWWPVLAPLYELGLREFVERHLAVGAVDPQSLPGGALLTPKAQLQLRVVGESEVPSFLAESFAGRQYLQTRPRPDPSGRRLFAYDLELLDYSGKLSGVR